MATIQAKRTPAQAMTSVVYWVLLGLVIERPSYGLELYHRFQRMYGDVLSVRGERRSGRSPLLGVAAGIETPDTVVVTIGVDLIARDGILGLLRSIADDGIAILASTGEGTGFLGADRALALHKGKLRGEITIELAPVTELDRHRPSARLGVRSTVA